MTVDYSQQQSNEEILYRKGIGYTWLRDKSNFKRIILKSEPKYSHIQ